MGSHVATKVTQDLMMSSGGGAPNLLVHSGNHGLWGWGGPPDRRAVRDGVGVFFNSGLDVEMKSVSQIPAVESVMCVVGQVVNSVTTPPWVAGRCLREDQNAPRGPGSSPGQLPDGDDLWVEVGAVLSFSPAVPSARVPAFRARQRSGSGQL